MAFDLLAEGDEVLCALPYEERRERLAAVVADPVQLTPMVADAADAGQWLTGTSEGVIAKQADAPYQPGERKGMVKIKRVRTADAVGLARESLSRKLKSLKIDVDAERARHAS